MVRNLAVVISGGVLGLALAVGALGANGATASMAGIASTTLLMPSDPPIIRGSGVQAAAPAYGLPPPIVDDAVQAAPSQGNDPPIIDD